MKELTSCTWPLQAAADHSSVPTTSTLTNQAEAANRSHTLPPSLLLLLLLLLLLHVDRSTLAIATQEDGAASKLTAPPRRILRRHTDWGTCATKHNQSIRVAKAFKLGHVLVAANCTIIAQFPIENHSERGQFAELPLKTAGKSAKFGRSLCNSQ